MSTMSSALKLIPAALTLALAGAAVQAQEATSDGWMSDFRSQRPRAEVIARAQVLRELQTARASGEHASLNAEAWDFQAAAGEAGSMIVAADR